MSIRICANGFILKTIPGQTKAGKLYARGSICLKIPLTGTDDSHRDQWVNFVCFDEKLAQRLADLKAKSTVGFAGTFNLNVYEGQTRPNIIIDEIISVQKPKQRREGFVPDRAMPDEFPDDEVDFGG